MLMAMGFHRTIWMKSEEVAQAIVNCRNAYLCVSAEAMGVLKKFRFTTIRDAERDQLVTIVATGNRTSSGCSGVAGLRHLQEKCTSCSTTGEFARAWRGLCWSEGGCFKPSRSTNGEQSPHVPEHHTPTSDVEMRAIVSGG